MERLKGAAPDERLNGFRGWLLVFFLFHVPLAFYNVTAGVYALANYIKLGAGVLFAALSLLLCLLLPAALVLLLRRKALFRPVFAAYSLVMAGNYLLAQGVSGASLIVASLCTLPWLLYVYRSRRVAAVLAAGQPPAEDRPLK